MVIFECESYAKAPSDAMQDGSGFSRAVSQIIVSIVR